jgi:hypothetical protein
MNSQYFILIDLNKNYLKPNGTTTKNKIEAATFYYNKDNLSIIYQNDKNDPSNPYYREQVCVNGCNGINSGYCLSGKCKCINGSTEYDCKIPEKSNSGNSGNSTGLIIVVITGSCILLFLIYYYKKYIQDSAKNISNLKKNNLQKENYLLEDYNLLEDYEKKKMVYPSFVFPENAKETHV